MPAKKPAVPAKKQNLPARPVKAKWRDFSQTALDVVEKATGGALKSK